MELKNHESRKTAGVHAVHRILSNQAAGGGIGGAFV